MDQRLDPSSLLGFLGAGGHTPGLSVIRLDKDPWEKYPPLVLPRGESVYAIARLEGERFAVGTKEGKVRVFYPVKGRPDQFPFASQEWSHGAPILALCGTDSSHLAVGDTLGRCLVWHSDCPESPPVSLRKPPGNICSLLRISGDELLGLSSGGEMLCWRLPTGDLQRTDYVPAPPSKNACIHLTRWQAAGAVAYAARGGQLALYDPKSGDVASRDAHEGNFFAVAELQDQLITAGYEEPCLRLWDATASEPLREIPLPDGTLGLAVLDPERRMVLRIHQSGRASVGILEDNELRVVSRVEGENYRVAIGPSSEDFLEARSRQSDEEIDQVFQYGRQLLSQRRFDMLGPSIERLRVLGREKEAYGLALESALARGHLLEELRARLKLGSLEGNDESRPENLEAMGRLLERLGWFEQALARYETIPPDRRSPQVLGRMEVLARTVRAVREGRLVMGETPEAALPDVLAAGDLLGERFTARWVAGAGKTIPCPGVKLSGADMLARFEQVIDREDLHAVHLTTLSWAGTDLFRETEALVFAGEDPTALRGLELAVRVEAQEVGTVLDPFLVLNADRASSERSVTDHHRAVLLAYEAIQRNHALTDTWYTHLMGKVLLALRRLVNHKRAANGSDLDFPWRS